jgi:hypothetical protein
MLAMANKPPSPDCKPKTAPAPKPFLPKSKPEDVFGSLRDGGKPKSIADMHAAIPAEVMRRRARGRY